MATQEDYTTAANAIASVLYADITKQLMPAIQAQVPSIFMGRVTAALAQLHAAIPGIAGSCAKLAVDSVDAEREYHATQGQPK